VEGSIELRYSFPKPKGVAEFWADKIARSGAVLFFDWGNSFNRLTPSTYNLASVSRIFNPVNWGYGYGIGFRFDTPAGPFRLDMAFPLYDPNSASFRSPQFSTAQYHIGLGHAF
jgi:outer membrane protein assembly factor BamA